MKAYKIRPLEWESSDDLHTANTIFGNISIELYHGDWYWEYCFDEYYDEDKFVCESLEDGKEKAEEFYLKRLMPALEENGE